MNTALASHDEYYFSPERIILTETELHIPGIRMFAKHASHQALEPLSLHYHQDAFEFTLLLEGNLSFATEEKTYHYYGGDVFISYPNEIHSSSGTPLHFGEVYWFQLDISDPNHFLFLEKKAASDLIERLLNLKHHVITLSSREASQIVKNAFSAALNINDPGLTASYLTLFLHLLILSSNTEKMYRTPDIETSLSYIREHICDRLTLEELAEQCGLSVSQYKRKFKQQVGIAPRNYINQQKIDQAKQLLMQGHSVTDTAMLLNFDSSSYFSVVFKKYSTQSPTAYIKRQKETQ